jgi:hypothetical protein
MENVECPPTLMSLAQSFHLGERSLMVDMLPATDRFHESHEYLRLTGSLAVQWFFFGCTINAAVAAFLYQTFFTEKRGDRSTTIQKPDVVGPIDGRLKFLPALMIVCNFVMAFIFLFVLPLYYLTTARVLRDSFGSAAPFPYLLWSGLSAYLAANCAAIAYIWRKAFPHALVDVMRGGFSAKED